MLRHLSKWLLAGMVLAAPITLLAAGGPAIAQELAQIPGNILRQGPVHDPSRGNQEACMLCHIQRRARSGATPLWDPNSQNPSTQNRSRRDRDIGDPSLRDPGQDNQGQVFANLRAANFTMYDSPSMDMRVASQPQGVSAVCLSCHDGAGAGDNSDQSFGSSHGDLQNSHPISVTYNPSRDQDFFVAVNGRVNSLPLYGQGRDQVECATCHDPHGNHRDAMLRMSNDGSALCLTCHNK